MLIRLENPKILYEVVGIISELVLEVRLNASKEGLSILAIDPANVAMVLFSMPASAFSRLDVDKPEVLGVSLESLKAVLRRIRAGSVLTITKAENELKLEIEDKIKREFNLALIDIETTEKPVPNLEFTSKIEMASQDFSEVIEDCSVVAESCSFISEPNVFVIEARGNLNSFKSEFKDGINIESEKSVSKYSLEYLQKMIKASRLSEKACINFSTDYPLRLDFNNNLVSLSFILAPRVETE